MPDVGRDECVAFFREKLDEAEKWARARDEMAKPFTGTKAEWDVVMSMHPSTLGKPMPTPEQQRATSAVQTRIADKLRREAELYRAAIELLEEDVEQPCSCGGRRWVDDEGWEGDGRTPRRPGEGRIPCGFCNLGGWDALRPDQHWHRCARHREGCPHRWECLVSACSDPTEERLTCSPCHPTSIEKRGDPLAGKKAHVRRAPQTREHACHWPGCTAQVPPAMWGCKPHWMKLPKALRDRVWRTYVPGQEETLTPSADYLAVADDVQRWIREHALAAPAQRGLF